MKVNLLRQLLQTVETRCRLDGVGYVGQVAPLLGGRTASPQLKDISQKKVHIGDSTAHYAKCKGTRFLETFRHLL